MARPTPNTSLIIRTGSFALIVAALFTLTRMLPVVFSDGFHSGSLPPGQNAAQTAETALLGGWYSSHIPPRPSLAGKILAVLAVMGSVAGILTAIMTWANTGLGPTFLRDWGLSFAKAFFVLMPIAMLLMTLLGKLAEQRFRNIAPLKRNIALGLVMSVIMQSLVAVIAAGTAVGFADGNLFGQAWANAFLAAFPVGLALALLLTTLIKPRLESYLRR